MRESEYDAHQHLMEAAVTDEAEYTQPAWMRKSSAWAERVLAEEADADERDLYRRWWRE